MFPLLGLSRYGVIAPLRLEIWNDTLNIEWAPQSVVVDSCSDVVESSCDEGNLSPLVLSIHAFDAWDYYLKLPKRCFPFVEDTPYMFSCFIYTKQGRRLVLRKHYQLLLHKQELSRVCGPIIRGCDGFVETMPLADASARLDELQIRYGTLPPNRSFILNVEADERSQRVLPPLPQPPGSTCIEQPSLVNAYPFFGSCATCGPVGPWAEAILDGTSDIDIGFDPNTETAQPTGSQLLFIEQSRRTLIQAPSSQNIPPGPPGSNFTCTSYFNANGCCGAQQVDTGWVYLGTDSNDVVNVNDAIPTPVNTVVDASLPPTQTNFGGPLVARRQSTRISAVPSGTVAGQFTSSYMSVQASSGGTAFLAQACGTLRGFRLINSYGDTVYEFKPEPIGPVGPPPDETECGPGTCTYTIGVAIDVSIDTYIKTPHNVFDKATGEFKDTRPVSVVTNRLFSIGPFTQAEFCFANIPDSEIGLTLEFNEGTNEFVIGNLVGQAFQRIPFPITVAFALIGFTPRWTINRRCR